ncbi:unnamed protein product [Somion occarium]
MPVLGNLHQLPTRYTRIQFTSWAEQYGGIFSLKIAHGTTIVITSPRIIREFMDKRSASTADRPPFKLGEIIMDGLNVALAGAGNTWKNMRRAMHMFLTREACSRHLSIQHAEGIQLMYDLLKQPEAVSTHVQRQTISIILSTVFGIRTPRFQNSVASEFADMEHILEEIFEPGAIPPVDLLPVLQYIPEIWAPWKRTCRELRQKYQKIFSGLRDMCETRMKMNRRNGCFLEDVFNQQEKLGLTKPMIAAVGAACLEAGAVTTTSFFQTFILCLVHHPHVQRKAQAVIDDIVGTDRLPTMDDFDQLPYLQAVVHEVHRFFPPIPLGIPHRSTTDETVEGYLIPKGSTIFMNYYGIYHDPKLFDRPESFYPERYLLSEFGTKPGVDATGFRYDLHFGSGRRICPGIHFAGNAIKMNVINLLWAFDFHTTDASPRDEECPIRVDDFLPGIATGPKPFSCVARPRSEAHAELIRSEYTKARPIFSKFEQELSPEEAAFIESW